MRRQLLFKQVYETPSLIKHQQSISIHLAASAMKDPVRIPIEDALNLPSEAPSLLGGCLPEWIRKEIFQVCIIHGKGSGILKRGTRSRRAQAPITFKEQKGL